MSCVVTVLNQHSIDCVCCKWTGLDGGHSGGQVTEQNLYRSDYWELSVGGTETNLEKLILVEDYSLLKTCSSRILIDACWCFYREISVYLITSCPVIHSVTSSVKMVQVISQGLTVSPTSVQHAGLNDTVIFLCYVGTFFPISIDFSVQFCRNWNNGGREP